MNDLTICPICKQIVDEFQFDPGNDVTTTINCLRCGRFRVEGDFSRNIHGRPLETPHLYSGAIRELNERGVVPVTIVDRENFLSQVIVPRNPLEMMDRFLLSLQNQSNKAGEYVMLTEDDYALAYCQDRSEWLWICRQMAELGLIEPWSGGYQFIIRPGGWSRLLELSKVTRRVDQAFVAMSFDRTLDDLFNAGIKLALDASGYVPFRVDRNEHNGKIDDLIIAEIRRSGLLVADFTLQRNGVYYEAGFALGLGIPVIWTCKNEKEEIDALHFDTRQYNHIMWDSPEDLRIKLINRIAATVPAPKK